METLLTERLILRPIGPDDLPFLIRLHADPRVACTLADGRPRTEEATRTWFSVLMGSYTEHGLGQLAVCRCDDGRLLGRCGLTLIEIERESESVGPEHRALRCFWGPAWAPVPAVREIELGWVMAHENWGNGYASEAARAIRDDAFRASAVERLVSVIFIGNTTSERVALKMSMARRAGTYLLGDRPVWVYEVNKR